MMKKPATSSWAIIDLHTAHFSNWYEQMISLIIQFFSGVRASSALIFVCSWSMANLVPKVFNFACLYSMYNTAKRTITVKMLAEKKKSLSHLEENIKFYGSIQTPCQYAFVVTKKKSVYS